MLFFESFLEKWGIHEGEKNSVIFPEFSLGGQISMGFCDPPKNALGLPLDAQK